MKILLLTDSDVFAGTERHILDLAATLQDEGFRVVIGCPESGALAVHAQAAGIPVEPIEKRGSVDIPAVRRIAALLRSGSIDLVHAHNGRCALIAALAQRWAGRGRFVFTQHFLRTARESRSRMVRDLSHVAHRWVAARASRIVAISEAVKATIVVRGDCPAQKVTVVHNGIRDPLEQSLAEEAKMRQELGIPLGAPLIVATARLEVEKGLEWLIDAMPAVMRHLPAVRCLILGEGRLRADLERRIILADISGSVSLCGFRADVLSVVKASDLFVLPSPAEPFGLALVEAMALSRPVIATQAGGPAEIVEQGRSGLLVPPSDAPALAAAILELLLAPERARNLGRAARKRFCECFTARQMAARMAELYREVSPIVASEPAILVG